MIENVTSEMGGPSHEIIALSRVLMRSNNNNNIRILDLGCAEGRNAFFLVSRGFNVTAIDKSKRLIKKLKRVTDYYGMSDLIETKCQDVRDFESKEKYDVVLAHGLIHFLNKDEISSLIKKIKCITKMGGLNIYTSAFYQKSEKVLSEFKKDGHNNALSQGELKNYYDGWKIDLYEKYFKYDFHPDIGYHSHPIEKWIFNHGNNYMFNIDSIVIKNTLNKNINEIIDHSIINKDECHVEELLGKPDQIFEYMAEGPQFGYQKFSEDGYQLKLILYGNILIYNSNGKISGFSILKSNYHVMS